MGRLFLRAVAGKTWLIDTGYKAGIYKEPLCINETGAAICELIIDGMSDEDIAHKISEDRNEDYDTVLADVTDFSKIVRSYIAN